MFVPSVWLLIWSPVINAEDKWQVSGVALRTQDSGVNIDMASLSIGDYMVNNVSYQCPETLNIYPRHACQNALAKFEINNQKYEVIIDSAFTYTDKKWSVELMSTNRQLVFSSMHDRTDGDIKLIDFQLENIFKHTADSMKSIQGVINGQLKANLADFSVKSDESFSFNQVNYEYSDDIIVADLSGQLSLDFNYAKQTLKLGVELVAGEMLIDQLYVNFANYPIHLDLAISTNDGLNYTVNSAIKNPQSLLLKATILTDKAFNWSIPVATIEVFDSHHFNQNILSSVLGIYGFGRTEMSGGFNIYVDSTLAPFNLWRIKFNDFYALNSTRKLQIDALDGYVNWNRNELAENSKINWDSLVFAGMPVNQADLEFNFSKDQFKLLGDHVFSVFDGSIQLKELAFDSLFSPYVDMSLNASVLPISLKQITQKLGWPEMSGTISGDIPGMIKKGSVIEFLGGLELSVFEGQMLIENLSLERLFGVAPVIAADVSFNQFNLSLLTETFGFGQITGRLSGVVNKLRITNWKTDRLDAQVFTVKTKGVKQTISQRAIENISSLGGIKGAISKTFLRFFDDFSYKKIKLSCKLHNSVCQIGGLKNQNNQFVIVEGGGIPKINIVGFVRTINWEEFIDRLLNANYDN